MSEKDLASSQRPISEPSSRAPMTRIKFFRIRSSQPAQYDAILGAYDRAPQMPAIQIPRTAIIIGDMVETAEIEVPSNEVAQNQENVIRGDGLRVLRRPQEVVIVSQSEILVPPQSIEDNPFLQKPADYDKAT